MTVIVACKDEHENVIGCDTIAINGTTLTDRGSKLIERERYTIAFAGSYRVADLVREDRDGVISTILAGEVRHLGDVAKLRDTIKHLAEEEAEGEDEAIFVIVSPHGIFTIENGYQIHEIEDYVALGSGEDFALGSFATTGSLGKEMKITVAAWKRVHFALEAAIEHCSECGGRQVTRIHKRSEDSKARI